MDRPVRNRAARQPFRNLPLGLLLQAVGWPGTIGALACWAAAVHPISFRLGVREILRLSDGAFLNTAAYMAIGLLGVTAIHLGKRLASRDARRVLAKSRKPPILYLRSFLDEGAGRERLAWSYAIPLVTPSDEEHLVRALKPLGPVVAVGRPGEATAEVGAARLYLTDANWQDEVQSLLEKSQLVVLRIGTTEGFWWEVERAVKSVSPDRLLFFLGRKGPDSEQWESFRERALEAIPTDLPKVIVTASFLAFKADWTPDGSDRRA